MPKFRKRPVVIEAVQFEGQKSGFQIAVWSDGAVYESPVLEPTNDNPTGYYLQITTLEGVMTASPGDWIIKGVQGKFYPCKDEIFKMTYEPVPEHGREGE